MADAGHDPAWETPVTTEQVSLRQYVDLRFGETQRTIDKTAELSQRAADRTSDASARAIDKALAESERAIGKASAEADRALRIAEANLEHHIQTETARLEAAVDGRTEYTNLRFAESQRAIDKAEHTMNLRLEGMNAFRQQLNDQAAEFVRRNEFEVLRGASVEFVKQEVFDASQKTNQKDRDDMRDLLRGTVSVETFAAVQRIVYMGLGIAVVFPILVGIAVALLTHK